MKVEEGTKKMKLQLKAEKYKMSEKNTKSKGADQRGHKRGRREWVGKMKGRGMEWLGSEGKVWVQNGVP